MFLYVNGMSFEPNEQEYGDLVLAVASSALDKSQTAIFFQKHVHPR
jgi:prophage maintenance system killer protein